MWIRDNRDKSRITDTTFYNHGRLERGRGRCSLTLFHVLWRPFWGVSASSSFMKRLHPLRVTLDYYDSWPIVGILTDKHSKSILILGINPWRRTYILLSEYLGGDRICPSSLSYDLCCSKDTVDICSQIYQARYSWAYELPSCWWSVTYRFIS